MSVKRDGYVKALDTISGQVAFVPQSFLKHPVFSKTLVEVDDGKKPYAPEFYTPKTPTEYLQSLVQVLPTEPDEDEDIEDDDTEDIAESE